MIPKKHVPNPKNWLQPLWKTWKSVGIIIPNKWKIIKFMFQTTNPKRYRNPSNPLEIPLTSPKITERRHHESKRRQTAPPSNWPRLSESSTHPRRRASEEKDDGWMAPNNMLGLPGGFAVSRNEFARRVTYVKIMYVHPQPFSRRKFHGIFSVFHWFHISICKMFAW